MLLSIVTGTYNRRPHLAQMVASARACIPRGIEYEFVIVDGGSTDGTIDWCEEQSDIVLIQQGELLGAIRAFDAGAEAARGDYVLLGNDDIVFAPNAIIPALTHLETTLICGAVAFKDNRPAPGYETNVYKVQTMQVRDTNGAILDVPYVQVGIFRRWLGEACGWWGSHDPIMSQGHTYGGDNFLSARVYEHGYRIDTIDGCQIADQVSIDDLRSRNGRIERERPGMYYQRYKQPPQFPAAPLLPNVQEERLRILYLPIFEPHEPAQQLHKKGLREALSREGLVYEIDYVNTRFDLPGAVKAFQPHLLLMQCHAPNGISVDKLKAARQINPNMIVVNWNGDVYEQKLTSKEMLAWLKHVDLQLTVNANVLPIYAHHGIPAAYWQVSFEPVDYDHLPAVPPHDVVFLANCYSDNRRALGQALQSMPGVNVGLYGRGWQWGNGECTYNFPVSTALNASAKIVIGDNQFPDQKGFVSNRIFETLASGGFLLHQTIPGLRELTGITPGVHFVEWRDVEELQKQIRHWLQPRYDEERRAIAASGRAFVHDMHNFNRRIEELFRLIQEKVKRGEAVA